METEQLANEILSAIQVTVEAHTKFVKTPKDKIRFWDKTTPYAIHPIWCAMTILTETTLPEEIRMTGYKVLLWHDILEDTNLSLPANIDEKVQSLLEEMKFDSFEQERELLWERSDTAKLLKLYDKVSNLLDATWMPAEKWNLHVAHAQRLTSFVAETYGNLNIVKIAKAICILK